jgi:hypothetical protein
MTKIKMLKSVFPAQAGIHPEHSIVPHQEWIPAFAGKTKSIFDNH